MDEIISKQSWRDYRADRSRVWSNGLIPADVAVTADLAKHGAGIQARTAADAVQRFAQRGISQTPAPVIEDDQVTSLVRKRLAQQLGVDAELLRCRGARQQREKECEVIKCGEQPLHPHQGDVRFGQGRDHAAVTLIRDETKCSIFHNAEVHTADPDIGRKKYLTQ